MADRSIKVVFDAVVAQYRANVKGATADTAKMGAVTKEATAANSLNFRQAATGVDRYGRSMQGAARDSSFFAASQRSINTGFLATATVTVAAIGGMELAAHTAAAYGMEVYRLQLFTGGSAEATSKLVFALHRVGIDTAVAIRGIAFYSRNLENNNRNMTQYFTNQEVGRLKTLSFADAVPVLINKYQGLNTVIEKNAFLVNVFGRGGYQMRRLFELTAQDYAKLSDEAQKFGLVLRKDNIDAFRTFSDEGRAVGQSLKGLEVQIGAAVLPAFATLEHGVIDILTTIQKLPPGVKSATADILLSILGIAVGLKAFGALKGLAIGIGNLPLIKPLLDKAAVSMVGLTSATGAFSGEIMIVEGELVVVDAELMATDIEMALLAATTGTATIAVLMLAGALAALIAGLGIGYLIQKYFTTPMEKGAEKGSYFKQVVEDIIDPVGALSAALGRLAGGASVGEAFNPAGHAQKPVDDLKDSINSLVHTGRMAPDMGAAINRVFDDMAKHGELTAAVLAKLTSADALKQIRDTANAGGDVPALIARLAREGKNAGDQVGDGAEQASAEVLKLADDTGLAISQLMLLGDTGVKEFQAIVDAGQKATEKAKDAFSILSGLDFGKSPEERAQALTEAIDALASANFSLADAQDRVKDNERYLGRTPKRDAELAKAKRDVAKEQMAVTKATKAEADARKAAENPAQLAIDNAKKQLKAYQDFIHNMDILVTKGVGPKHELPKGYAMFLQDAAQDPAKYSQLLDAMVSDHSGHLIQVVNDTENKKQELGVKLGGFVTEIGAAVSAGEGTLTKDIQDALHRTLTGKGTMDQVRMDAMQIALEIYKGITTGLTSQAHPFKGKKNEADWEKYVAGGGKLSAEDWYTTIQNPAKPTDSQRKAFAGGPSQNSTANNPVPNIPYDMNGEQYVLIPGLGTFKLSGVPGWWKKKYPQYFLGGGIGLGRTMHSGGAIGDVPFMGQSGEWVHDKATAAYWGGAHMDWMRSVAQSRVNTAPVARTGFTSTNTPSVPITNTKTTEIKVGQVVAHDYHDFKRQIEREQRRLALVGDV